MRDSPDGNNAAVTMARHRDSSYRFGSSIIVIISIRNSSFAFFDSSSHEYFPK
jgi:hypothetical protein